MQTDNGFKDALEPQMEPCADACTRSSKEVPPEMNFERCQV